MSGQLKLLDLLKNSFTSEGNKILAEGRLPEDKREWIPSSLVDSNLVAIGYGYGLFYAADIIDKLLGTIKSEASEVYGTDNLCNWCLRPLADGEVNVCSVCRRGDEPEASTDTVNRYSRYQDSEVSNMDNTNNINIPKSEVVSNNMFICVAPCPKLDADGDTHCRCLNAEARDNFKCPFGLTPVWEDYE